MLFMNSSRFSKVSYIYVSASTKTVLSNKRFYISFYTELHILTYKASTRSLLTINLIYVMISSNFI